MASDLSRTGAVERDIEQVIFVFILDYLWFNFVFVFFDRLDANVGRV